MGRVGFRSGVGTGSSAGSPAAHKGLEIKGVEAVHRDLHHDRLEGRADGSDRGACHDGERHAGEGRHAPCGHGTGDGGGDGNGEGEREYENLSIRNQWQCILLIYSWWHARTDPTIPKGRLPL